MTGNLNKTYIELMETRIILKREGHPDCIIKEGEFALRYHQGHPYLELQDISNQLESRFTNEWFCVDVWVELGLSGTIYRYDREEKVWKRHGKTGGYA